MAALTAGGFGLRVWRMRLLFVSITAAGAVAANCGDNPTGVEFPTDQPYMVGRITSVTPLSDRSVSVRVETNPAQASGSPKAVARVDDFAMVRLPGNADADFRALAVGQWVRLWFDGAVMESYPVQGVARAVAVDSLAGASQAPARMSR